jgi:hypothetical protein
VVSAGFGAPSARWSARIRPQVRGRQVDALLGQGGVDAELAELGVCLQAADRGHRPQVDLARRLPGPWWTVL